MIYFKNVKIQSVRTDDDYYDHKKKWFELVKIYANKL